jgi:hypothetical protein
MKKPNKKPVKTYPDDITVLRCVRCKYKFLSTPNTCGCPLCIGEVVRVYSTDA